MQIKLVIGVVDKNMDKSLPVLLKINNLPFKSEYASLVELSDG